MPTIDLSAEIVKWANWAVVHQPWFGYRESRPFPLYVPTVHVPIWNDCSATAVWCCWMAKILEPFAGAYAGEGNTESFLSLEHVPVPRSGDFVVYGEGLSLSVQHMGVIVKAGLDPMTMSHGWSGEPAFVPVSKGCPPAALGRVTFVRANTLVPAPPPPPPPPIIEDDPMFLVKNPHNGGMCLLHGDRWSGVPNPPAAGALAAQGLRTIVLTVAQFDTLVQVPWGQA